MQLGFSAIEAKSPLKRPDWTTMLDPADFPSAESWYAAERKRLRDLLRGMKEAMDKEALKTRADSQVRASCVRVQTPLQT
jgi:hypothetical protein